MGFLITFFAVPFLAISNGELSLRCMECGDGEGDFGFGEGDLSSAEESSPPASASNSASRSAMIKAWQCVQSEV